MLADLTDRLSRLVTRRRGLAAGEPLFRRDDPVRALFLVEAGEVSLVRHLPHGQRLTLQRAEPGGIVAEASLYARRYHCDAVAEGAARLGVIPVGVLERALAEDAGLADAWTRHLALEVQRTRAAVEIATLKKVADRLDAWLDLNGGTPPPRGRWHRLASEIGVSPEALYREMAKRR